MDNQAKKEVLEKLIEMMQQMEVEELRPKPAPEAAPPAPESGMHVEDPEQPGQPEEAKFEQPLDSQPPSDEDDAHMLERLKAEYAKLH